MAQFNSYPGKTTPVAADKLLLADSAASDAVKIATIAQLLNNAVVDAAYTPSLGFGGAAVGMTYAAQNGRYIKLGNLVIVEGYIVLSAKGSSTGNAAITLPVAASASYQGYLNVFWSLASNYVHVGLRTAFGGASADILGLTAAGAAPTQLTHSAFDNASQLRFSGVYFA